MSWKVMTDVMADVIGVFVCFTLPNTVGSYEELNVMVPDSN